MVMEGLRQKIKSAILHARRTIDDLSLLCKECHEIFHRERLEEIFQRVTTLGTGMDDKYELFLRYRATPQTIGWYYY